MTILFHFRRVSIKEEKSESTRHRGKLYRERFFTIVEKYYIFYKHSWIEKLLNASMSADASFF